MKTLQKWTVASLFLGGLFSLSQCGAVNKKGTEKPAAINQLEGIPENWDGLGDWPDSDWRFE
jgi:hypothetical protein